MRNSALIVAAGRGSRMKQSTPKQYLSLREQTVLERTINIFIKHCRINNLQVVINPEDEALYAEAVSGICSSKLCSPVFGGASTQWARPRL